MFANIFDRTTIPVLQEVVYFSQARHEVLAGNIANIDTPGYKTADLSPEIFQQKLREAIAQRQAGRTNASSAEPIAEQPPLRHVRESMRSILRHDESDVGLEQQVLALTENQLTHNIAIALMNSQFRLLETAISERIT